ncbi:uncharacterized protein LOC100369374 [Saccoglossus kowalevskii]|uniref:Uncharacterized protein LOC100369374 n=1 Tax=Saccoglossus kowalevskii TaxID=10224 RepID=A0ABM0GRR9_SACKO|nr:PREDICTED: uncharacterized protein LOC100369374 [Saccoglossus kowalevskii]
MAQRLTPEMREVYNSIIQEQLNRDFIEKIVDDDPKRGHYIPHHPVEKQSSTTPIRVVYNCSAKYRDQPSLNECLETGPSINNDLVKMLLRFRTHNIGLSSDIEKTFLNVKLAKNDQEFTKFFWLKDPSDPHGEMDIYRFKVVLFGSTSSPFMLNAVIKTHLESQECTISKDLKSNIYVDNVLTGVKNTVDATKYYERSTEMMRDAGLNLRSWATNDPMLRNRSEIDKTAESKSNVNILGLRWNTHQDTIHYPNTDIGQTNSDNLHTKREIVRYTSRLFDPLGYLAPVHVKAKSFIQKLWKAGLFWDTPISADLTEEWGNIRQNLDSVKGTTVNRIFFTDSNTETDEYELHVFADASKTTAHGAVVYLKNGNHTSIVIAKSRLNPVRPMTLPHLELVAATIATRLADFVLKALTNVKINKCVLWSDSQITIHWIRSHKTLPVFVENRVREIRAGPFDDIKYCPTAENPANLLTRGITTNDLNRSKLWWEGPHWLKGGKWPKCDLFDASENAVLKLNITDEFEPVKDMNTNCHRDELENVDELKPCDKLNTEICVAKPCGISKVIDIDRFQSLSKLLRVTTLVSRFISNLKRDKTTRDVGSITTQELCHAETMWIYSVQNQRYCNEKSALKSQSNFPLARQIKLYLDDENIIRCGGRIHNAPVDYDAKFPILLPAHHKFSELSITQTHAQTLHSGVESTVTLLRQRYWIPKCRSTVKSVLYKCITCKRLGGKSYEVPLALPLPSNRVTQAPPFRVIGLDYTGELHIKRYDGTKTKAYICLFTCASTRAVHLEVVPNLTPAAFLRALRRFAARRSYPHIIISDNQSKFCAANNELNNLFNENEIKSFLAGKGITWNFIPKRAPNFGGFYERLIGMTKNCLCKVLGCAFVNMNELVTLVCEIEAVLNDRPLTHISTDINDPQPLTPLHLINGRLLTTLPHTLVDNSDADFEITTPSEANKRAKYLPELHQRFHRRWLTEYILALRERHQNNKNNVTSNRIKIGDIVLVHSDTQKRLLWPLAKVEKLHVRNDGLVRSADIRTKTGKTSRPICKLYPLELGAVENNLMTGMPTTKLVENKYHSFYNVLNATLPLLQS